MARIKPEARPLFQVIHEYETRPFLLLLALTSTLELVCALIPHPVQEPAPVVVEASLPVMRPGCSYKERDKWWDCFYAFEDGTYLRTRGY